MTARYIIRLAARLALPFALWCAGCGRDATSLLVRVMQDASGPMPVALAVDVAVDGVPLRIAVPVSTPDGRPVASGDTFPVLLPDTAVDHAVTVTVTTPGRQPPLSGAATTTALRDTVVAIEVHLTEDGSGPHSDAAVPVDAALPPDGGVPDLARSSGCPMPTTCANGIETACVNGMKVMNPCPFGCAAAADGCLKPDCMRPADISSGGLFTGSSAGFSDNSRGSCAQGAGPDFVTSMLLADWRTVTIDTAGSMFDTALYTQSVCGMMASEIPIAGPCAGAMAQPGVACQFGANNSKIGAARLVLCSLPPNTPLFTWLDSVGRAGPFKLKVALDPPASLNDCAGAGNLLDGNGRTVQVNTANHFDNFKSNMYGGTGLPDSVYFLSLTSQRGLTITTSNANFNHSVYVRTACLGADIAGAMANMAKVASVTVPQQPAGTMLFVVVDGSGGMPNSGTLTFTVQ